MWKVAGAMLLGGGCLIPCHQQAPNDDQRWSFAPDLRDG
jgi:hypothetical protein